MKAPAPMKVMKAKQVGGGVVADALATLASVEKVVETADKVVEKAMKIQAKSGKVAKAAKPVAQASSDEESSSSPKKVKTIMKVAPAKRVKVAKVLKVKPVEEAKPEEEDESGSSSSSDAEIAVPKAVKQVKKTVVAKATKKAGGKPAAGKLAKAVGAALKQRKKSAAAMKKEAKDVVADRAKELKAMKVADLKDLVASKGLEKGVKEDMIKAVLDFEARLRAEAAAKEAKISSVVQRKRQELAALSMPELKDLLADKALKLGGGKDERVDRLLAHWREQGEVEKILEAEARDARREQLCNMDKTALRDLCEKSGVDTLVKEVLIERLLMHETVQPKP